MAWIWGRCVVDIIGVGDASKEVILESDGLT